MFPNELAWRYSLALECLFYWRVCRNWRTVVRGRLRDEPFERFELRSGGVITFAGDPPWHVFGDIWWHQVYSHPPVWLHSDPRVVIDIGANIGCFTLYAAARWPSALIHAYEPAPENFAVLTDNVELSGAQQVFCHPSAVAAVRGTTTLYLKQESGWHSIWKDGTESSLTVPTTTLEDVVAELDGQPIDFLKLDCEGAEYEILKDRESLLSERVQQVAMEYHEVGGHDVSELSALFERAGFHCEIEPVPQWKTGMLYAMNQARLAN